MTEEKQLPTIINCVAQYTFSENESQTPARVECNLLLDSEKLTILPKSGEVLSIPYREVLSISKADYKIAVNLVSREKLTIYNLGTKFEDFFRALSSLNNDVLLRDLLMNETMIKSGLKTDITYLDETKKEKSLGQSELKIYETAVVIIVEAGDILRIPYSTMDRVRIDNYSLYVETDYDETYMLSKMGKELDVGFNTINDQINKLSIKTQLSLKELLPRQDTSIIRKIARLLKDGRAARCMDIEAISPGIWSELEKRLTDSGNKEEYEYIKSIAQPERICIGFKRGLVGDLTGDYIWFLMPIFSLDPTQFGNAVAMETISSENSSKATYFFRITDRDKYLNMKDLADLRTEVDKALSSINRHLININFRREPIYLSDEQLNSIENIGYQRSVSRIPSLRELRRLFIGRVMHHSFEQWKASVTKLLESNLDP